MSNETLLRCRFSDSGRGFGFAELLDGSAADIFIAPDDTMGAMTGDTVLVHRYRVGESGYTRGNEGQIAKIVERGNPEIIGTFRRVGAQGVVTPDDKKLHAEIRVAGRDIGSARDGDKVSVKITDFPRRRKSELIHILDGYVTAVFGSADTREANYAAVLHKNGIPTQFSDDVIWEAEDAASRPVTADGRLDLRGEKILTIDSETAKDLDDAVSLTRTEHGWRLGVHIADVSHYVPENSAVDREAYSRGTSVYFVDKVVPMLPEALSNGACSLNAGVDRCALSALIDLDESGAMIGCDFKKSVIRTSVRGVYSEVNDIFAVGRSSAFAAKYLAVLPMLEDMHTLYEILARAAKARGQLALDSAEAQIVLDARGLPVDIVPAARGDAEKMIEQFMLTANVAAATWLHERALPCLYRVHEDPMPEKMQSFAVFAHNLELDVSALHGVPAPAVLSRLLDEAESRGISETVSGVLLRSLAKAKYSEKSAGHYGLALELYCHFTSPIRRYPDLFVHRAISAVLTGSRLPAHPAESARTASEAEMRAVAAEREIEALYMAQYAAAHVGEEFGATITSVCSFGIFARTDKLFEGLIPIEGLFLRSESPEYDEQRMILHTPGRVYRLGDTLTVRVERADVASGEIDLVLAGGSVLPPPPPRPERAPRREFGRPRSGRPQRGKPRGDRPHGDRPHGGRPQGGRSPRRG